MLELISIVLMIKYLIFCSVIFVWIVRYQNIVEEFKQFGYPAWLRDFVGILKLTFVVSILSSDVTLVKVGSSGICLLMLAAVITHLKVKNPFYKMMPSISLLTLSALVLKSSF